MLGKQQLVIDASDFVRGASSSAEIADGGFSPETDAVNLTKVAGVLYAPANVTDKSTNLNDEILAWCATNTTNLNGYAVDDSGYVYSISSSQVLTASAQVAGAYTTGTTDIVHFIDKVYFTSETDVARIDTDLANPDNDWWSSTQSEGVLTSGVRHPLLKYQDRLWVGDANAIHKITDSSNTDQDALVLGAEWEITALGIDPSTGRMLIAATQGQNYSNTLASRNIVFIWDGTSDTYLRQYDVAGMITAFHAVGGIVYVAYGIGKIGYWNGSGVTFLRQLLNVTLAGANLPYKHHLTSIDNTLYVVDGTQILAYGEVLQGRKVWYPALKNNINSNVYNSVFPVGSGLLGVSFSSAKFYTFDTTSVSTTGTMAYVTNWYRFPRPIEIRGVFVEWYDAITDGVTPATLYYINRSTLGSSGTFVTFPSLANSSGSTIRETPIELLGILNNKGRTFKFRYTADTNNLGLARIVIYYDVVE